MKNKLWHTALLLCILASLSIQLLLFWNTAVYADEHNTSPEAVYGGKPYLYASWAQTGLLLGEACICFGLLLKKRD